MSKILADPIIFKDTINTLKLARVAIDFETGSIALLYGAGNTVEGNYKQIKNQPIHINKELFGDEIFKIFGLSLEQIKTNILNYGETVFIDRTKK